MDKEYWTSYYSKKIAPLEPSQFAKDIGRYLIRGKRLLELGCGNGRDSISFYDAGLEVTAIDQAENIIKQLSLDYDKITFYADDFVEFNKVKTEKYDYIYSRFTLHAITAQQEGILLKNAYNHLETGGMIFIEVRTVKDELYGLGKMIGENEFVYQNHYRRFADRRFLEEKLRQLGFAIEYSQESRGFAKFEKQNPIVLRIIAKK